MSTYLLAPVWAGAIGLAVAMWLYIRVKSQPAGNETMNRIATYVREGAMAFLVREASTKYFLFMPLSLVWRFGLRLVKNPLYFLFLELF
jgi:K(+)-stimulated pyrophosphate-energized sodium pump